MHTTHTHTHGAIPVNDTKRSILYTCTCLDSGHRHWFVILIKRSTSRSRCHGPAYRRTCYRLASIMSIGHTGMLCPILTNKIEISRPGDCRRISREQLLPLGNNVCPVLNGNPYKQLISLQSPRHIHTLIHIHVSYACKLSALTRGLIPNLTDKTVDEKAFTTYLVK